MRSIPKQGQSKHTIWTCVWVSLCVFVTFSACQPSEAQQAAALVAEAQQSVQDGSWKNARLLLDSVHRAYPKQVAQRRLAKALSDSITYLEAQRTIAYSDSLLQTLLPQVDELMRHFKYEKNSQYENHGKYVHRLLATTSNTSRNFLQAYVQDDRCTIVKSYYYGAAKVNQKAITISSENEDSRFSGANHTFQAEGWHEIMTFQDQEALQLLNFISTHSSARIRIQGEGESGRARWTYYLSEKEKTALTQTYQLGFLMKDIRQLEQALQTANAQVQRFVTKQ